MLPTDFLTPFPECVCRRLTDHGHDAGSLLRLNYFGYEAVLWKVLRVQGKDKISSALFCAKTERIVFRVGRYFHCGTDLYRFRPVSDQIDDLADQARPNSHPPQDCLVFTEDVFRVEPDEVVVLRPIVKQIGIRVLPSHIGFPEP